MAEENKAVPATRQHGPVLESRPSSVQKRNERLSDSEALGRYLAEIEHRFQRGSGVELSFYIGDAGKRTKIALTRPFRGSRRVSRRDFPDAPFHGLTLTEHAVATAVALGLRNDEIGASRGTAKRTVDRQVSNILGRLGFDNRTQLASFIAVSDGWLVPFPEHTLLEAIVPVLGVLGGSTDTPEDSKETPEAETPTLIIGSLLPSDPERGADALAMSRGEELAARGPISVHGGEERFPVRIIRHFVEADEVDAAIDAIVEAGVQGVMLGNFSIPTALAILENEKLRGIPILHSMVNRQVDVFAGPHPRYQHIFKMCADEFVYLRALSAYIRAHAPETRRVAVLIRDGDEPEIKRILTSVFAQSGDLDLLVVKLDERMENHAEIALDLLHFSPDVIYLGVFVESTLVELVSHIRGLLPSSHLFCVWVPGIPGFMQRHPEVAEGLVWSTLVGNSNNYFGVRFRAAFETAYRADPGIGAAAVHFDMVNLLRRAWQDSGTEPLSREITHALSTTQFTGVTGTFHFENGLRRTLCHPFDTDDPSIGQPCLTFEIRQGRSVPLPLPSPTPT